MKVNLKKKRNSHKKKISKKRTSRRKYSKKKISKKRISKKRISKKRTSRRKYSKKKISKKRSSSRKYSKKRLSKKRISKKRSSRRKYSKKKFIGGSVISSQLQSPRPPASPSSPSSKLATPKAPPKAPPRPPPRPPPPASLSSKRATPKAPPRPPKAPPRPPPPASPPSNPVPPQVKPFAERRKKRIEARRHVQESTVLPSNPGAPTTLRTVEEDKLLRASARARREGVYNPSISSAHQRAAEEALVPLAPNPTIDAQYEGPRQQHKQRQRRQNSHDPRSGQSSAIITRCNNEPNCEARTFARLNCAAMNDPSPGCIQREVKNKLNLEGEETMDLNKITELSKEDFRKMFVNNSQPKRNVFQKFFSGIQNSMGFSVAAGKGSEIEYRGADGYARTMGL